MGDSGTIRVGRRMVAVSNLGKVLYPAARFTKREEIDYYGRIAEVMLPHLRNRPVTLKRFPDGVQGAAFYEKDAPGFTPKWVKTFPVPRQDSNEPPIQYILINDRATLVWVANTASLELHPFLHRAPEISRPTSVVFDLDPGEGASILDCAEVAFLLQEVLDKLRLKCFPKVSGSKGIQVYAPLNVVVSYEATQPFARAVAELLAREHPERIVAEMAKVLRGGRVFIDWSQNAEYKTTVGVYSLRAKRERPFVSMPVKWEELRAALKRRAEESLYWEAREALARVKKVGDLFAPVLKLKQKLPEQFLARLSSEQILKPAKSLRDYTAKRDFRRTKEPGAVAVPRGSRQGGRRRFVVQKHAASHLHYDLRLEMGDVLKSWAVPKGMPLKKEEKVSAFATEDHPLEYLDFEGTIPAGEYGGGTVMVWDIGTYEIVEGNFWKGRLLVYLSGKKLKGEWTLERKAEDGKPHWLLIKTGGNAKRIGVKEKEVSAVTGRAMEEIAEDKAAVWGTVKRET